MHVALRSLGFVVVAVAAVSFAPAASAAFPGRDGELAVQPAGGGLLLVNPATGVAQPVCTDAALCGDPVDPRWSANGRALVFEDGSSSRAVVLSNTGSCLWCLLGPPLTPLRGASPAFTRGDAITFSRANGLWKVNLTGAPAPARLVRGAADTAVWSSTGALAFVRAGAVWVRAGGARRLMRIAAGSEPSWAPDGHRLAFARGAWVWIATLGRRGARRLFRGTAPAWSPDGRSIAFVGSGQAIEIAGSGGADPHPVGSIHGVSVDWQPLPRSATPCPLPSGGIVLERTAAAVLYSAPSGSRTRPYVCLYAVGKATEAASSSSSDDDYVEVGNYVLAGRFAELDESTSDRYGDCSNTLLRVDLASGAGTSLLNQDCGSDYGGVSISPYVLNSSGFSAWSVTTLVPPQTALTAISCPSSSLCVAADAGGNVLSSTTPTGGAADWTKVALGGEAVLTAIACPVTTLCVGVAGDGKVVSSADPTGPSSSWSSASLGAGSVPAPDLTGVSCPSVTLCVLAGGYDAWTSTDPTGGAGAWTSTSLGGTDPTAAPIDGVSCPSSSLCVAVSGGGDVFTSTDPAGSGAWQEAATNGGSMAAISCPTVQLCVAVNSAGDVVTSTDPTGGGAAWSVTHVTAANLAGIACESTTLCVATSPGGAIVSSSSPTGGASAWTSADVETNAGPSGVACPSSSLCLATDSDGNILSSNSPPSGPWSSSAVDVVCQPETPCDSQQLYAYDDHGIRLLDSSAPGSSVKSISNVTLSGDSTMLTWSQDGSERALALQ
jgi:hypothetical protein